MMTIVLGLPQQELTKTVTIGENNICCQKIHLQ